MKKPKADLPMHSIYLDALKWLASERISLMTPAEEGGYFRLICYDLVNNGIPDDDDKLAMLSRLGDGWFNLSAKVIRPCFAPLASRPGFISSYLVQFERQWYANWVEKSKKGGETSSRKRLGDSDFGRRMALKRWMRTKCEPGCEPNANNSNGNYVLKHTQGDQVQPSVEVIRPSLAEVLSWGEMEGVAPEVCRKFFEYHDGLGWMHGATAIRNPRRWLKGFAERGKVLGKRSGASGVFEKKTRLEQLEKLWEDHRGNPRSNYASPPTGEERAQFRQMTEEIKQLRHALAQGTP